MKNKDEQVSTGLNQLFELINAKGDKGEVDQILEETKFPEAKKTDDEIT